MNNNVVYRVAKALGDAGAAVLRFNFRGVGASTGSYDGGVGEEDDARAALDFLAQRHPGVPLWMAGFSFGARVGLTVGAARRARREAAGRRAGAEDVRLRLPRALAQAQGDHPGRQRRVRRARDADRGRRRRAWPSPSASGSSTAPPTSSRGQLDPLRARGHRGGRVLRAQPSP